MYQELVNKLKLIKASDISIDEERTIDKAIEAIEALEIDVDIMLDKRENAHVWSKFATGALSISSDHMVACNIADIMLAHYLKRYQ